MILYSNMSSKCAINRTKLSRSIEFPFQGDTSSSKSAAVVNEILFLWAIRKYPSKLSAFTTSGASRRSFRSLSTISLPILTTRVALSAGESSGCSFCTLNANLFVSIMLDMVDDKITSLLNNTRYHSPLTAMATV